MRGADSRSAPRTRSAESRGDSQLPQGLISVTSALLLIAPTVLLPDRESISLSDQNRWRVAARVCMLGRLVARCHGTDPFLRSPSGALIPSPKLPWPPLASLSLP